MTFRFFEPGLSQVKKYREGENLGGLLRALRAQDYQVSEAAAQALAEMEKDHTDYLIAELHKTDTRLKAGIIGIFSRTGNPKAVTPLIGMLADPASEIRWEAAIALGEIRDPAAIGPLTVVLADHDKYVRFGAARSLTKLGWTPAGQHEMAGFYCAIQDWDAVKNIGIPAIPVLDNLLNDRDPVIRAKVVRTLGEIGGSASSPPIIRALRDASSDVRWQAVLASRKSGMPQGIVPRALSARTTNRKNPLIAAFMNFMLPGLGYGYLGKWWGIIIFQVDITATVWLFKFGGESETYLILLPIYLILSIHAWYLAEKMPEEPP